LSFNNFNSKGNENFLSYNISSTNLTKIMRNISNNDYWCLNKFRWVLKRISKKFHTLSEGYYWVLVKIYDKNKTEGISNSSEYDLKISSTLFCEEIDKMPLLLNDPVLGVIAKFRLQVGR
jgi:hypothetical protein